jgi:hypothetical protein
MESSSSLDDLMEAWEENVKRVSSGTPRSHAFLDLAAYDMKNAADNIDCPYCRRHMLLEAEEIVHVLDRLRAEGNHPHMHGLGERARTLLNSFQIVANVLLGGLRRAGIIS